MIDSAFEASAEAHQCSLQEGRQFFERRREVRELHHTDDALDWARVFVAHVRMNPSIATDEPTVTTWFSSAIAAGWDAHYRRQLARKRTFKQRILSLIDITKLQRGMALVGRLLP